MAEMVFGLTDNSLYYCNMEILQGNRRKELGGLDAEIVADCLEGAYGNVGVVLRFFNSFGTAAEQF